MPLPIIATKLYLPPTRPKAVLRSDLVEKLNSGLRAGRKLTLISAPAGFGKTTLVSGWLMSSKRPAAWLSLDEGDDSPTRFLAYLVAALQTVSPGIGEGVLAALESSQPPPTELLLTNLLNETAALSQDLILVLDDYHLVDDERIDDALDFLVEHLPPQVHLAVISREDPQLPLARYRARDQITELRAADLRFSLSEAADFLNRVMGLNLSTEEIAALDSRTEGWIAGLQLAALSMQGHQDAAGFIKSFTGSHRFVLDYLLEEVLHKQPEHVQSFLLHTSILDRLCGPLCEAVLLDPSASGQDMLEYLERVNLFIRPLDNERRWYRYHRLFADLLQQRFLQAASTAEEGGTARYHIRASQWYEENDLVNESFQHAVAAQDFERAARVAELAWPGTFRSNLQNTLFLGWMKLLPEELIRSRPVLSVGYAWALLDIGELEAAEAHLRDAERCLDAGPIYIDEEVFLSLPATIALARAYLSIALGDIAGTVEYARRAFALLPEQDYFRRAGAVALLGTAYLWSGDLDASWETIQEGLAIVNHLGDFSFLVSGILPLADIRNVQGHLHEAIGIYERGLQDAPEHNQPALPGTADLYLGLSSLYLEQGNLEAAVEYLARSDELGEQSGLPAWLYRMRLAQARIKEVQADLDGALVLLQEAERVFFRMPLPEFRPVGALRARIWVRQGKLTESQAWARETGLSARDEPSYPREFELITLSRVLIAEYRRKRTDRSILEAIDLLEHLLKSAEEGGRNRSMIEILVMTALAHEAQGDIPAAITSLERAVFLGEPEGYIQIFADEGPRLGELLKVLKTKWKAPGLRMGMKNYVDQLLAVLAGDSATAVEPLSTVAQPPSSAEPLSERELEVLHLLRSELDGPEIARQLGVSLTTVRTHTQNIYKKLGVNNRRAAVRRAAELGLL